MSASTAGTKVSNLTTDAPAARFWRDGAIWLGVLLALALRVAYNLALNQGGHPPVDFVIDEPEYFGAAHVLAEGRGFTYFDTALWVRPPLFVAALAVIIKVAGTGYVPVLLFQALLGAATVMALSWLAYRILSLAAARWTALISALYLPFTLFAGLLLSETLFVLLFACSLVALYETYLRTGEGKATYLWAAASGALLGLCVLTRGTALAFVPLAAVWLFAMLRGKNRSAWPASTLVVGIALLALVPWTLRNYAAYGRVVAVDTTGGYNLWLAAQGVRDEERMQAELAGIAGPVAKQDYSFDRAFGIIAADPGTFAVKGVKESLDLWRPSFGAEERQVKGYTLGRVPAWHLGALLVLDDLLYVGVVLLAIAGLIILPAHPLKSLTVLWVLLWVGAAFVFFAVTRFRLPMVAAFIPWAGAAVALAREPGGMRRQLGSAGRGRLAGLVMGAVAFLAVALPGIEVDDTLLGIARWGEQEPYRAAETALRNGDAAQAVDLYERANQDVADTRYGLAAARLQAADPATALAALRSDEPEDRFEPDIIRGEAARLSGDLDTASALFNTRVVQVAGQEAVDWAWDHLRPPPTGRIELGTGLDLGYIRGFYGPERDEAGRTFRWMGPEAAVRGLSGNNELALQLSGWRPEGTVPATIVAGSPERTGSSVPEVTQKLPNADEWTTILVYSGQDVRLETNAFVPGGYDPRLLGVRIMDVIADRAWIATSDEAQR